MHRENAPQVRWPARLEHQHFIFEGLAFPATRADLVEFVTDAELDRDSLNLVRSLPDRTFTDLDDIWRAIGEATRAMLGNEGRPRDDMGKQAVLTDDGMKHP